MKRHAALLALLVTGCGSDFDSPSELQSVRILAVQKHPLAGSSAAVWSTAPGNELGMALLAYDGRPEGDLPLELLWFSGCTNPPGDLYYSCFPQLALTGLLLERCRDELGPLPWSLELSQASSQLATIANCAPEVLELAARWATTSPATAAPPAVAPALEVGTGPRFAFEVPENVVVEREEDDYGVSFVFFSACAGRVGLVEEYREAFETGVLPDEGLLYPLGCYDDDRDLRGPDHFVSGYSTLYTYTDAARNENANPPVTGARVADRELTADTGCVDEECGESTSICIGLGCIPDCAGEGCPPPEPSQGPSDAASFACGDYAACVPVCTRSDSADCPEYDFRPSIVREELLAGPNATSKQAWVRYYASAGAIERDPVRLYDSEAGWNDDYGTTFTAPRRPGPFSLWAAVHDSRGGVNWVRTTVLAE